MLKRLTTKNFRKLTDNDIVFGPGLQVVRGANEAGKTTMLEAIAYGCFGVKACRDPLAELVTWGQPERTLKVEQVWEFGGVEYSLTRSKAGAEINWSQKESTMSGTVGRVVGQNEVTAFMERMLGCDATVAGKLMIASQASIRGALEEGPTKTAELIEQLADFQLIDRVIDLIQSNLVTGPDALAEDRVKRAEEALAAAKAAVTVPDLAGLEARVAEISKGIAVAQGAIDAEWRPKHDKAAEAVKEASDAALRREGLRRELERSKAQQAAQEAQLAAAREGAAAGPSLAAIEAARRRVAAVADQAKTLSIFRQFQALGYPAAYWEGSEEAFREEVAMATAERAARHAEIAWVDERIRAERASMHKAGDTCGACGQKLPNAAALASHNASVKASIAALEKRRALAADEHNVATKACDDLQEVARLAKPILDFYARHPDKVQADSGYYPPKLIWAGPAVSSEADTTAGQLLVTLEAGLRAAQQAQARVEMLEQASKQALEAQAQLTAGIEALAVADTMPARQVVLHAAAQEYNRLTADVAEARFALQTVRGEIHIAKAAYEQALAGAASAQKTLDQAKSELEELIFNNNLLKRVRTARPVIADKLWSIVLTAVSAYFSAMRGTPSVVSREGKQFKVDGRSGALSGSTLDILGLSIRVALTRMFLPNATFLILDEPAAAMDDQRTAATMGFLVAAGFPQTLLVTHEEMSESVADNLIRI